MNNIAYYGIHFQPQEYFSYLIMERVPPLFNPIKTSQ